MHESLVNYGDSVEVANVDYPKKKKKVFISKGQGINNAVESRRENGLEFSSLPLCRRL